jgi:O-antigen/teichoic acid export membrane protein
MALRKSLFHSFAGVGATLAVNLTMSVVIARLVTPADTGTYSVAMAAFAILTVLRDFGINRYLVQETELTEVRLRTACTIITGLSWATAALFWLSAPAFGAFYGDAGIEGAGIEGVVRVLALGFLGMPLTNVADAFLSREMRFGAIFRIHVPAGAIGGAVGIWLALRGWGPLALAWGTVASFASLSALSLLYMPRLLRLAPSLAEWRRVVSFGSWATAAGTANQIGSRLPDLILGRAMTMSAVGLFSRAQSTADMFDSQIQSAVNLVALPATAEATRTGREIAPAYVHAADCMVGFAWPFYLTVALLAEPLVLFLFGGQWGAVAPLLQILCVGRMLRAVTPATESVLTGLGRVRELFFLELASQAVSAALVAAGALVSLEAVAASRGVALGVIVLMHLRCLRLYVGVGVRPLAAAALRGTGVTAVVAAGVLLSQAWLPPGAHPLLALAAGGAAATAAWLAGAWLLHETLRNELHRLLRPALAALGRRGLPDAAA